MKTKCSITLGTFLSIVIFGMFLTEIADAQGWYDQNWQYRRPVTIANPGGTVLTNYQVMITLNSSSFDFSKANSDGSDVRATDTDGATLIPFWIEEWNASTQLARVWFKIPSIPSGGSTVYLYYGYSTATTASNGTNTFNLFDDTWISSSSNLNPVHVATQPWWEAVVSYPIVFEDNSFSGRPRFHMLYDGHNVIGHAKGYATSPDLVTWTSYDNGLSGSARINPIMGSGYSGGTQFAWGDVIKVSSVYHMYPSGGPGTTVHCQSTDLIHWTNQSGGTVTYDALTTNDPSGIGTGVAILKEADGKTPVVVDNKYWMIYFHGFSGGSMYMAYADIGNLLSWTTCYSGSPVLTPSGWEGGGLWTPSFVKVNDKYYIYYQAGSPYKIGFASAPSTSGGNPVGPDNTLWTKSPNNPVISNTHGWDNGFCQDPVLRCFDGVYYIFYTGDPPWTNGFATSTSPEGPWVQYGQSGSGVNWTKTGTPAVSSSIISFAAVQAIQSPANYAPGTAVGFRANLGPQGGNENRWGGFITGTGGASPPDRAIIQKQVTPYAPDNNHAFLSTHPTYTSLSLLDNQFHVYEVLWRSGRADAILDHGTASIFTTSNVPSTSLPITFYNYAGTSPLQVDWVFIRQYSSPEPSPTVGAEQIMCPNPPGVTSPVLYCVGATAVPLTATGLNLLWYITPTGGTGNPTVPTPSTASVGTTSYYVSQTVNGCESDRAQIDVIVNETPAAPTADVIQPSCSVPAGTITVTSSISGLSFSIDGVNYTNNNGVFTGVNPGNYNLTAKNSYDCVSAATLIVINSVPGAPPAPTANVTQPTCTVATGTITITAPTGTGMTYSIDGINYTNTTGIFTGVAPSNYSVTAKEISGCISPSTNVTINPAPETPSAPTANVTHPTCSVSTGTITVTSSITGLSFSIDGISYTNTTGIFTGVLSGTYPLTVKNSSGCISSATMVTVNPVPPTPTGTIAAVDPDLCSGDLYYQLQLTAATGQAPYTLVVDGKTYTNVNNNQTFATINVFESIWNNSTAGIGGPAGGNSPWELGVKFRTTVNGYIRGIRFHKALANTGTHVGRLWTSGGTPLASATFTNETASGWQEVLFATPVAVTANTVYVASYTDPVGFFSWNSGYFSSSGVTSGHLYALSTNDAPVGNGVYNTVAGSFPSSTAGAANYWVDVVFSTWNSAPVTLTSNLTSITAADGCNNTGNPLSSTSVTINVTPSGTISSAGAVCEGTDMSLIFNASAGNGPFSLVVNSNTYNNITSGIPFNVGTTGTSQAQSIWPSTNGTDNGPNTTALELGVKFRSSAPGQVTGIRFYKVGTNTTGYSGTLWSGTGTQLATANFPTLPTNGWQQVNFTTPVSIQPNTTYVASYHVPTGNFAANQSYFANSGVTNGALTALQNGVDGGNGVYVASSSIIFPNQTYNSTNYWVDVVFVPSTNNYFELTSITSANGCVKTGIPINGVSVVTIPLPAITAQPSNSGITYGDAASFSVSASGVGLTYQWQEYINSWINITNGGVYSNATTATLNLTKPPVLMSGYKYRCVVSNGCDATSNGNATLTVTPKELTVTANSGQFKYFGQSDPVLTYSASGFVAGENASVLTGLLSRNAGEPVGNYAITIGTLAGVNYNINFTSANLEIKPAFLLDLTVFLQGSYTGSGQMNTALNSLLPASQPFNVAPWNYNGTETLPSPLSPDVVDWVLVELRSDENTTLERKAGLLYKNGNVKVSFTGSTPEGNYVVVWHRGHMPVMSATKVTLPISGTTHNLSASGNLYGTNPAVNLSGGVYGMIAGDVTQNGLLKYSGPDNDRGPIIAKIIAVTGSNNINGVTPPGYWQEDVTINGVVSYIGTNNDRAPIINNLGYLIGTPYLNNTYPSVVPGFYTGGGKEGSNDGPVDIQFAETADDLAIEIVTNELINDGIADNLQFTLAWKDGDNEIEELLNTFNSDFNLLPQGDAVLVDGNNYLVIVSLTPTLLPQAWNPGETVTVITFDKEFNQPIGSRLWIADNDFTSDNNGEYYLSNLGADVTGMILSTTVGIETLDAGLIKMYPNPVKAGNLFLQVSTSQNESIETEIRDMTGKLVIKFDNQTVAGTITFTIDVSKFNSGVYLINVVGDKIVYKDRFIIK